MSLLRRRLQLLRDGDLTLATFAKRLAAVYGRRPLAEYNTHQRIVFVNSLPRAGSEKVRRRDIVELFAAR